MNWYPANSLTGPLLYLATSITLELSESVPSNTTPLLFQKMPWTAWAFGNPTGTDNQPLRATRRSGHREIMAGRRQGNGVGFASRHERGFGPTYDFNPLGDGDIRSASVR